MLPGGSAFATIAFPEDQWIENLPSWIGENLRALCREYKKDDVKCLSSYGICWLK